MAKEKVNKEDEGEKRKMAGKIKKKLKERKKIGEEVEI